MYGWVWTLLFTPIIRASGEAAHRGGSRSSGGSRLPLSNYCGDSKVSCRAIPSWEQCASRLHHNTHTNLLFVSGIGSSSSQTSLYIMLNNHIQIHVFWSCCYGALKLLGKNELWGKKGGKNCLKLSAIYRGLLWKPLCSSLNLDAVLENTLIRVYCLRALFCNSSPITAHKKTWLPSWVPGSASRQILLSML